MARNTMRSAVQRKRSFYLPADLGTALDDEAARQDRSQSWLIQTALRIALPHLRKIPAPTGGSQP